MHWFFTYQRSNRRWHKNVMKASALDTIAELDSILLLFNHRSLVADWGKEA